MERLAGPGDILDFWREAGEERWFESDPSFDAAIAARFTPTLDAALRGDLAHWEATPDGALALVIVLDQFPRNLHRGTPGAYLGDAAAVAAAERAVERGDDGRVEPALRRFLYLPFMHAEDLAAQDRSVALNAAHGGAEAARYAAHHRDIVARFGRFPHRNAILGRTSTPDEEAYMASANAFKG